MNSGSYKLIVLHGWGHDKGKWNGLSYYFEPNDYHVFDLPGFGEEPLIDAGWGIPEYAAWAQTKIESVGQNNIILLGHSFGGRIAAYIASQNPSWLKGLILYGSPTLYRPSRKVGIKIRIAKLLKALGFSRKNQGVMYPIFKRAVTFDQTKSLPNIKAPTLILWGENDREVPLAIAKEMHTLIPSSQLAVMEGAGHNAHLENPNLFYGTVKRFIKNI